MLSFNDVIINDSNNEKYLLLNETDKGYLSLILSDINFRKGLYSFFEEQDLKKAKQCFYNCGLLDAFRISQFNARLFTYDLHSIGYAMLSDNIPFVRNNYANLTFTDFYIDENTEERIDRTMEDHVLDGDDGCVFVHTIQQFLLGNEDLVRRNIEIIERVRFGPKNQNNSMQYDVNFFKALLDKDKSRCEAILKDMVSPKIHQNEMTISS